MTTRQYTGLLAVICVVASPFVASQWLRFAKAQHEYQKQLDAEKPVKLTAEEFMKADAQALQKTELGTTELVEKQWNRFRDDVQQIRSHHYDSREVQIWCDNMSDAIAKKDFTLFNYYVAHVPEGWQHDQVVQPLHARGDAPDDPPLILPERTLQDELHFPDLNTPGLTPADIAALSKFIKPDSKEKAAE